MSSVKIQTNETKPSRAERLLTLARRCEQARTSSQAIDEAIALEFGWKYDDKARTWVSPDPKHPVRVQAPPYTLLFEHTKHLLPSGFSWSGGTCDECSEVVVSRSNDERFKLRLEPGNDATFLLAFASVCLRAHAATEAAE